MLTLSSLTCLTTTVELWLPSLPGAEGRGSSFTVVAGCVGDVFLVMRLRLGPLRELDASRDGSAGACPVGACAAGGTDDDVALLFALAGFARLLLGSCAATGSGAGRFVCRLARGFRAAFLGLSSESSSDPQCSAFAAFFTVDAASSGDLDGAEEVDPDGRGGSGARGAGAAPRLEADGLHNLGDGVGEGGSMSAKAV